MKWPWTRESTSDKDVDVLRAQADATAPVVPHGPFRMVVEDVFTIRGRGTVATGKIESGTVRVGQQARILRAGTELATTTVTGVEMFKKVLDSASAGDNVGLLLGDVSHENVMRGDVLES